MAALSGLAFGNQATNLFLIPASLLLSFSIKETGIKNRIIFTLKSTGFVIFGFVLALWPIKEKIVVVIKRIIFFAGATGVHGSGEKKLFDLSSYLHSANSLLSGEKIAFSVVVFAIIASSIFFYKKKDNISNSFFILSIIFTLGIFTYAKFPLVHYQLINYTIMVFVASYYFSKLNIYVKVALILLLLMLVIPKANLYYSLVTKSINKTTIFENYVLQNPSKVATVWEFTKGKDFGLIWSRGWAGGLYSEQIAKNRQDLFELKTGFEKILLPSKRLVPVFDVCWDQLYIQKVSLPVFLELYPETRFNIEEIVGTDMVLARSDHCETTTP